MNIAIVIPIAHAEREAALWAHEELSIDFRREPERAARCTMAFAALELTHFLQRCIANATLTIESVPTGTSCCIELGVMEPSSKSEAFELDPTAHGIAIRGQGRTGALYGAYELLRLQGWRWYAPGALGEVAPPPREALTLPPARVRVDPSMHLARGFTFEPASLDSAELLLWMARNRLNLSGYRRASGPLGEKLGMRSLVGGHIFEPILNPDRPLPSGQTIWDAHPEWYGLPADGVRTKPRAMYTQFCVSRPDLIAFLGDEILRLAMGEWKDAERLSISGFDTWGGVCHCAACSAIGSGTDQTLHFMSELRRYLDTKRREGQLDHHGAMFTWAYEGTGNLEGPTRAVPANLLEAGDYIGFAPIKRCYAHDFADHHCPDNALYRAALASWFKGNTPLLMSICEYYNVSKYEDLPLLFTTRIAHDLPAYHAMGVRGMSYMHPPLVNWGPRTLTQVLYAQLCWDIRTDTAAFLQEYFENWYGPHAAAMKRAYGQIEKAWLLVGSWRNWGPKSVLSQLQEWDGATPQASLAGNEHLPTPAAIVASGRKSVRGLNAALRIVEACRLANRRLAAATEGTEAAGPAVNQVEAQRRREQDVLDARLGEDRRLLIYGRDTMQLMAELAAYHDALFRRDAREAEVVWKVVERVADRLDSRYQPIGYEQPGPGLVSKDALTRTQLGSVLRHCRRHRPSS